MDTPKPAGLFGRIDKLGVVIAAMALCGLLLPLANYRANRIVQGELASVFTALPSAQALIFTAMILITATIALFRTTPDLRFSASILAMATLAVMIGIAAAHLSPPDNSYARVSPASGFWMLLFAYALLCADCLVRFNTKPLMRIALLAVTALALAILIRSGLWDGLSVFREYQSRADSFWNEAEHHIVLAIGSLLAATIIGIPLGVLCHRMPRVRASVLNSLNIIQTIPSMALFGIMIAPLGWIALHVPGASAIGIRGIGMAPAFVALFLYSLLPVVANTVVGLGNVSPATVDAARGMGMTGPQRLLRIEFPLAFAVILTGIRIVLVQNIGLATIAALIGGGGFGVFVFQGIGQMAMDLVLLGALPTVMLAFAAAVVLDAGIELASPHKEQSA